MNITIILSKAQKLMMLNTRVMKTNLQLNYLKTYLLDRYNKSQQVVGPMLNLKLG